MQKAFPFILCSVRFSLSMIGSGVGKFLKCLYSLSEYMYALLLQGPKFSPRAFASRKSVKISNKDGQLPRKRVIDSSPSSDDYLQGDKEEDPSENSTEKKLLAIPSRSTVLQACTVTSGLIAALGIIIRQVGFSLMHNKPNITN